MKRPVLFILSFILLNTGIHAQLKPMLDSLQLRVDTAATLERKINAMNDLSYKLVDYDNDKAFKAATEAKKLSDSISYSNGQINALITLAQISKEKGDYKEALQHLKTAVSICESTNDSASLARSYYTIGDVFKSLKSHDRAIIYFKQAYDYYVGLKDWPMSVIVVNKVAHTYLDKAVDRDDSLCYEKAMNWYNRALEGAIRLNEPHKITVAYVNLANAYNKLGNKTKNKDYLFKSLDFSMRGLKLAKQNKDKVREAMNVTNIGEVYESLDQLPKALSYYKSALKIFEESGVTYWIIYENGAIGKICFRMKKYPEAIEHTTLALEMAKKKNLKNFIRDNYIQLAEIYADQNNYEKAYSNYREGNIYRDSISNENNTLSVLRLETELESDKKDKEIELLNKNNEIKNEKINNQAIFRNSLIIAVVFLLMLLMLLYNRYLVKQKAAEEILKAKEIQEQFLANTSHEIRTPMNGIIGMTSQLLDSPLNKEQLEYAEAIKESSNNLLVIINDLLDLSKIKAGKMAFEMIPFNLTDLCKNLIFTLQYRSSEKDIHLISSIDEKIPSVLLGDPVRLNQVLLNLAGNAIKFTEKGEVKINVKLLRDDGRNVRLFFSVQDTGIGIPNDKLDKIFESFTQVNATTTRKYGGTGLGLTIAKQIIEQQGGKISVSSKVNEGSTFSFILDFKRTDKQIRKTPQGQPAEAAPVLADLSNVEILVVDDNRVNQRVASLTLKKWNASVSVADNAASAIELLQERAFHVILMDIAMPEMDGIIATQHIRTQLAAPASQTPIIAMTASALIGEEEKCISAGMNDYISKPFNPADLYNKIRKLVPEQPGASRKTIDLTLLHKRAEGDKEYLKEIFESYITEMPDYLAELNRLILLKDWPGIGRQAHKMKSPIALVGAHRLKKLLERIELEADSESKQAGLAEIFDEVDDLCLKTIEEIKGQRELL
jgi:signal transduction histidine kinase/FixJ family two-component response regulator